MEKSSSSGSSTDILENMKSIHRKIISFKKSVLLEHAKVGSNKEFKTYTKKEIQNLHSLLEDLEMTGKDLSSDLSLNSEESELYKELFKGCNEALAEIMKVCN